jgi:hypothetical protein
VRAAQSAPSAQSLKGGRISDSRWQAGMIDAMEQSDEEGWKGREREFNKEVGRRKL